MTFNIFLKEDLAEKVTSEHRFEGAEYASVLSVQMERIVSTEGQGLGVCSGWLRNRKGISLGEQWQGEGEKMGHKYPP